MLDVSYSALISKHTLFLCCSAQVSSGFFCIHLDCAVVAVEDVDALLGVCLVNDQGSVAFVVLYSPLPAQH